MVTEDDVAKDLRAGEITVAQAIERMSGDDVLVYQSSDLDPDTATWEDVEEAASGSSDLFAALHAAGASEDEMNQVGTEVQRLRDAGLTVESRF